MIPNKDRVKVSPTQPTTGEKVWIQKGKNLFNKNKVVEGYELQNTDGSISKVDTWWVSEYISVKSNETYYLSANENRTKGTTNAFYDENKNYLGYVEATTGAILIPENAYYVRFNGRIDEIDSNIMFEQGTVATEYEEYIEPKIHIKNDNGVYEEFISKDDNLQIYSTAEKIIGKWIDGKTLYRKVITTTVPTTTKGTSANTEITIEDNVDFCMVEFAYFEIYNGQIRTCPHVFNESEYINVFYVKETNKIFVRSSSLDASNCTIKISLLYTKTTD